MPSPSASTPTTSGAFARLLAPRQVAQRQCLVAGNAAGAQPGVIDPRQRVAVETVAADRRLDPADDRGRGLAAQLLVHDRASQRVDRIAWLAPAGVGFDLPPPGHPRAKLSVALLP